MLHLHTTGSNGAIIDQVESRILGYKQFASIVKESVEISGEEMTLNQIWELGVTTNISLSKDMDSLFTKQVVRSNIICCCNIRTIFKVSKLTVS